MRVFVKLFAQYREGRFKAEHKDFERDDRSNARRSLRA